MNIEKDLVDNLSVYQQAQSTNPLVSVVMATYNTAKYLRQAVESILNQTFTDFEFVIVDDGSQDETDEILISYPDPRLVLIKNEQNIGLTRSLNRGFITAKGKFIARQDADDLSLPERLRYQVAYMNEHPSIGLVGSSVTWIDAQNKVIKDVYSYTDPALLQQTLLTSIPFLHGTFLLRRSCLEQLGRAYDNNIPVAQDCELLFRLSERWDVANLPEILYLHRRHKDMITAHRAYEQKYYLQQLQLTAIMRRRSYGWGLLGFAKGEIPFWVREADRSWLSQRFVWWSAAARDFSRITALEFLLIAILLDWHNPEIMRFMKGILQRKLHLQ